MERKRNYIYPDRDTMTAAFVCEIIRTVNEYAEEGRQLHIALSGGSTPVNIFRQLAEQTTQDQWENVSFYWGDERCVPPDDPESNYGNARETFLKPLNLPGERVHRIRGEEKPLGEADRYGQELMNEELLNPLQVLTVPGLHQSLDFQHPDYGVDSVDHRIPDRRNTLFWNPLVTSRSSLRFFVGDMPGEYQIQIRGITSEGRIVSGSKRIQVVKQQSP